MADSKITGYTALTSVATSDLVEVVDVSDTSMAASGTNKQATVANVATAVSSALGLGSMATETATNYVAKSLYDANTILAATSDNTPAAVTVAEQRIVGRITSGNITALTGAEVAGVLSGADTGGMTLQDVGAVESRVSTVASTGATLTFDTSVYGVFDVTMDQACEFTFSNPAPSGECSSFVLILRGAFTPTFPTAVDWGDGSAPTYTTPSVYVFTTVNGGTVWFGSQVGKAFA